MLTGAEDRALHIKITRKKDFHSPHLHRNMGSFFFFSFYLYLQTMFKKIKWTASSLYVLAGIKRAKEREKKKSKKSTVVFIRIDNTNIRARLLSYRSSLDHLYGLPKTLAIK